MMRDRCLETDPIEREVAHRPWPLPSGPWVMFQSWRELLFAHWPVDPGVLRPLVPSALELDPFDGRAWIGLTPFWLTGLRARLLPPLPGTSSFPEMNLRTYVRVEDRPGIFFFSLDAGNLLAILGARLGYGLPYYSAQMQIEKRDGWIHCSSRRRASEARFIGRYRPSGPKFVPQEGSLEHFLVERYALYRVFSSGRILRGEIHHRPWLLQPAEAEIEQNTVPAAHGIELPTDPPLLHYSARQDTLVWPPHLLAPRHH